MRAFNLVFAFCVQMFVSLHLATAADLPLSRGINVWPLWGSACRTTLPSGFCTKPLPDLREHELSSIFSKLRAIGFDFLRIPVDPQPFVSLTGPNREALFIRLVQFVRIAGRAGLRSIIDLHPQSPDFSYKTIAEDKEVDSAYRHMVEELASFLAKSGVDDTTMLELMNEPTSSCGDVEWEIRQKKLFRSARAKAPQLRLVLNGACYDKIEGLRSIDADAYDELTYYTFHYYEPDFFTHQGALWRSHPGIRLLTGLPWPSGAGTPDRTISEIDAHLANNPTYKQVGELGREQAVDLAMKYFRHGYDEKNVRTDFARVADWARINKVPHSRIILGEFGVLKRERRFAGADMASAARWLEVVRKAAEAQGFPWAMWNYKAGMALSVRDDRAEFYPELVRALGLSESQVASPPELRTRIQTNLEEAPSPEDTQYGNRPSE